MPTNRMESKRVTRAVSGISKPNSRTVSNYLDLMSSSDTEDEFRAPKSVKKKATRNTKIHKKLYSSDDSDSSTKQTIKPQTLAINKAERHVASPEKTPRKGKLRYGTIDSENVTPPKQHKSDKAGGNSLISPSSLFKELDLNSPPNNGQSDQNNGRKNIYQSARKALYSSAPKTMPGREKELEELTKFINKHLREKSSGSMYISGPPGTGKTATLTSILQNDDISKKLKHAYINCTALKSHSAVYSKIVQELNIKCDGRTEKEYISGITKFLLKSHRTILLVLDELDQLSPTAGRHQTTLYTLFSLTARAPNLILIGIANALDLTSRLLPRLHTASQCGSGVGGGGGGPPALLHFAPYTRPQIERIFAERLREAVAEVEVGGGGGGRVFDEAAVGMLAGKVAAMSGDVRRALDIGRRVVEMVEGRNSGATSSILKSLENGQDSTDKPLQKTVNLQQVVSVLNTIYGTGNNLLSAESDDESFPLQQKIIICSLLLFLRKAKGKDVTVGKLHEIYKRICSKRNIVSVDQSEFYGLLGLVETRGIIRVFGRKEARMHKINLEWDEEEVELALKDKQLISSILQDDTVLGKC